MGLSFINPIPHTNAKLGFSITGKTPPEINLELGLHCQNLELSAAGSRFTLVTPAGEVTINLPAIGRFNVANALAAAGAAWVMGVDKTTIADGLTDFQPQLGRMQPIYQGQAFGVIIDFAHTPDALETLLQTAREITTAGRVITVFGCGGDRDRGKRPLMGKIASQLSDVTILTDDNPRSENPATILEEIYAGCQETNGQQQIVKINSRKTAIHHALNQAKPGDTVLIAGKGHETYPDYRYWHSAI